MSYTSISQASHDQYFIARVEAAVQKEAWLSSMDDDKFALEARQNVSAAAQQILWPICIDTEAAYESALAANNPQPGLDPAVISDGMILSSVQAHWLEKA